MKLHFNILNSFIIEFFLNVKSDEPNKKDKYQFRKDNLIIKISNLLKIKLMVKLYKRERERFLHNISKKIYSSQLQ